MHKVSSALMLRRTLLILLINMLIKWLFLKQQMFLMDFRFMLKENLAHDLKTLKKKAFSVN